MSLSASDFDYVRSYVKRKAAISLETGKEYLVESRLTTLATSEGFKSLEEMIARLKQQVDSVLHDKVVESMTTNETFFFRDVYPFEALKKQILPDLMSRRRPEEGLSIWCAASSSGQEPYTLAMVAGETLPALKASGKIRILASDISVKMLDKARKGLYTQLEVNRGLPAPSLVKYFQKVGVDWQVKDELRNMVDYRVLNLAVPFPPLPPMDIVFIRNVLIYFETETKKKILEQIRKILKPDGYLFLGGSETTFNIDDSWDKVSLDKTVCYKQKPK